MKFLLYVTLVSGIHLTALASSAVTYSLSGGRFGDNLVSYANALWIAYKRDIPLVYYPFDHSEQLALSQNHYSYWEVKDTYSRIIKYEKHEKFDIFDLNVDNNTLHHIAYFSAYAWEINQFQQNFAFDIDWHDKGFVAALRRDIALIDKRPPLEINFPEGRIPVAVHVRTGEGVDRTIQLRSRPSDDELWTLKFPPNSFFIEQIKRMSELLDDQPLYVHIFTDSRRPEYFARLFEKEVNKPNIMYDYHDRPSDILDDFFAMSQFKYFIRGDSNFAFMASILAQYKISIVPTDYYWKGRELIITKSQVLKR